MASVQGSDDEYCYAGDPPKMTNGPNPVGFIDPIGRHFELPFQKCPTIKSARECMPGTFATLEFWIDGHLKVDDDTRLAPGTEVQLRASPHRPLPFPPPLPQPKQPSPSLEGPPDQKHSNLDIHTSPLCVTTEDLLCLPYNGCVGYQFWEWTQNIAHVQFGMYQTIRTRAPPGRWCNEDGEVAKVGNVVGLDQPEACIGPVSAGSGLEDERCRYITVWEGKFTSSTTNNNLIGYPSNNKVAHHLDGDRMVIWNQYPSRKQLEFHEKRAMESSYSIKAGWAEIDVCEKDETEKERLRHTYDGTLFYVKSEDESKDDNLVFAVIGPKK